MAQCGLVSTCRFVSMYVYYFPYLCVVCVGASVGSNVCGFVF